MGTTIAAVASPPGGGVRGILRMSGPRSSAIVRGVWAGPGPLDLAGRGLHLGRFRDRRGEQPLLLLWMPGPRSFTREDVAEFHLPGSPPLLEAGLARLLELGAVPAAPGEFTRRAFLSGRIDLTRAEGVLTLVSARNEEERRAGLALLAGGLADRVQSLRGRLEDLRALVEASLDFDPRDTGHVEAEEILGRASEVRAALAEALSWESARVVGAGEPRIVLAGAPNAGKSALFNRLTRVEGAIVSPLAGTTRDVLEAEIDLDGIAVRLLDTAGLLGEVPSGTQAGPVERAAQAGGASARDAADLLVWVVDASDPPFPPPPAGSAVLLVWNKIDRPGVSARPPADLVGETPWVATSAQQGSGIDALRSALGRGSGAGAGLARGLSLRHREALERAAAAVDRGLAGLRGGAPLEILAEDLACATASLDDVTGATTSEDVLDRIFARFCVGK